MSSRNGGINWSIINDSDDEENLVNYLVDETISNDTIEIDDSDTNEDQGILNKKVIFIIFKF